MKKIYFVLNKKSDYNFDSYIEKYLDRNIYEVSIGDKLPLDTKAFDLVVLWNYKKILTNLGDNNNIMVFHSSNLPEGRGWSPIFYSLYHNKPIYFITGILACDKVDMGDIVVQAKFSIKSNYIAKNLRKWDEEICILLINKIFEKFPTGNIVGKKQIGEATFNPKRSKGDNELDLNLPLISQVKTLRACEDNHPAFFIYDNVKYKIFIEAESVTDFPEDLEIVFPE